MDFISVMKLRDRKKNYGLLYPSNNEAMFSCISLGKASKHVKESDIVYDSTQHNIFQYINNIITLFSPIYPNILTRRKP